MRPKFGRIRCLDIRLQLNKHSGRLQETELLPTKLAVAPFPRGSRCTDGGPEAINGLASLKPGTSQKLWLYSLPR